MKQVFLFSVVLLLFSQNVLAHDVLVKKQADEIYTKCQNRISQIDVSKENNLRIKDIIKEQKIRRCLKANIIDIAQDFITKNEIQNLKKIMDDIEHLSAEIYRILVFCPTNEDDSWCNDSHRQENSLGKLVLEKNITAQVYNILTDVIKSKSGGYIF